MDVFKAQEIRVQAQELSLKLGDLETEYSEADRSGKIKITKERKGFEADLDFLKGLLKDAPPVPINPDEIYPEFIRGFVEIQARFQRAKVQFIKDFRDNPTNTIKWGVEKIGKLEEMNRLATSVLKMLDQFPTKQIAIIEGIDVIKHLMAKLQGEIVDQARWGVFSSTSLASNMMDHSGQQGKAEFYDQIFGVYDFGRYEDIVVGVKSWVELNNKE